MGIATFLFLERIVRNLSSSVYNLYKVNQWSYSVGTEQTIWSCCYVFPEKVEGKKICVNYCCCFQQKLDWSSVYLVALSFCSYSDTDQKEITVDETYCWSTDHLGRPIDIYSDPDYRMLCIGFWKENLKSYLITYDQLDAFTKYRCWVRLQTNLIRYKAPVWVSTTWHTFP